MDTHRLDAVTKPVAPHRLTRRAFARTGSGLAAGLAATGFARAAAQGTPVAASDDFAAAIDTILADSRYVPSRLGVYVADRQTGETIFDIRGDEWFLAASTTKLFSGAAALDALGPDFRFETPVYRTGPIATDGTLDGDLILVASGDPTMGGRDTADGQIAFTPIDHINATAFPDLVTLTPQDPLTGLNDLAGQVAAAGIMSVAGEVIVDDRLFPTMPKDTYILSPIWINDNLIDLTLTPGRKGDSATLDWRPMTAAYSVESDVRTVAAGEPADVSVTSPGPGRIAVSGQIPAGQNPVVPTYQVEEPAAFARTLLIEALERAGVAVAASPTGANPVQRLSARGGYAEADRVALHRSLPFAENLKLIFKTSHNQHADLLIFLLALHNGETSYDEGMLAVGSIVEQVGIDPAQVSLSDGRGNEFTDLFSPRTAVHLLASMATRPDFPAFFAALPVLGVDGTETTTVPPTSPVAGNAAAKSGMTVAGDAMNQRGLVMTRALAGFLTGKSGREAIFGLYLNNVPMAGMADVFTVITDHGAIVEAIFDHC